MNPLYYRAGTSARGASVLGLTEWRELESANPLNCAVDRNGDLLDNLTLELRIHPPEITIDNKSDDKYTVVTLTSANRPGSLIHVVQHFTELGLRIHSSRVTSCGGWFVDVFKLTESNDEKVWNLKKLASIQQMLNVYIREEKLAENGDETDDMARVETTVFEISGPDRPGLLDDVVNLLALNGCDVRSAAVWTYRRRSAFVLSVTEKGAAVTNAVKLGRLRQLMREIIGHDSARVACKQVRGEVHHDRRLHQQMLREEVEAWKAGHSRGLTDSDSDVSESTTVACAQVADTDEDDAVPGAAAGSKAARPGAVPVPVPSGGREPADVRVGGSPLSVSSSAGTGVAGTMGSSGALHAHRVSSGDALRSPKYDRPEVDVSYDHSSCYWVVTVLCRNRNKLLFDTACTLADLDYDIWHATIESLPDGMYSQEYYVRPRDGDAAFDAERAALLRAMLYSSIRRRFPRGLKLHVHSLDRYGSLAELTRVLRSTGLTITRAKVRTYATSRSAGHTFYVMDASGRPPNKEAVERACRKVGGNLVEAGKESFSASLGSHRFSFSFLRTEGSSHSSYGSL